MKYTVNQIEEMSNYDVNVAVAKKYNPENSKVEGWLDGFLPKFNPCSNWNDVMPIALKYGMVIELSQLSGTRVSYSINFDLNDKYKESWDENPCRAICEVFLMID